MSNDDRSRDEASATNEDGRIQLTRRPLPDRAHRIADDLAGIAHELREGNAGTSDQRLRLAAAIVSMRMLADDLREQLAAANERAETEAAELTRDLIWQAETERDSWKALAVKLDREAKQLCARLDALGELREEWRFDDGAGWFTVGRKPLSDADVRHLQKTTGRPVEHRLVGGWREVPDATADGHSATQTGGDRHGEITITPDGTETETTRA